MSSNPNTVRTVQLMGRPYTLHITTHAMAKAERESGLTFAEIVHWFSRFSITGTSAFLFMCLTTHHPEMTLAKCVDLMDEVGGAEKLIGLLAAHFDPLLASATADEKDLAALGIKTRPQKAQTAKPRGTGTRSSRRRVTSA